MFLLVYVSFHFLRFFLCTVLARELVRAAYPYTAEYDFEITFKKGDVIEVISESDPGWWTGEVNGTVGHFPNNYVKHIKSGESILESIKRKMYSKGL